MKSLFIIISVFFLTSFYSFSQRINIGIYSTTNVKTFVFTPTNGNYTFIGDTNFVREITENDVLYVAVLGEKVTIKTLDENYGNFREILLIGQSQDCSFKIKPVFPDITTREYDNDLRVFVKYSFLMLVNHVELESYISGVVESEGGGNAHLEYYKSQAIICRTYALANINRHAGEGFNLCDGVHCQAYFNKSVKNEKIPTATQLTRGLIIVDTTLSLITAAFHSNCGGQTANSEDVWLSKLSYCRSINDYYCRSSRNAEWKTTITVSEWINYLKKNGITVPENTVAQDFAFAQTSRKVYYSFNNQNIQLKKIRADWKLKSTFFSIVPEGNNLVLNGKGFGHGVGLCQEGAMKMANTGFTYDQIIKFYYKNTYTISLRALEFFKEPVKIHPEETESMP
ncbi:MAG: SpoIID/LytB domain-containing protein [Bacteroidales bacterium]|nr:SpoIID/LytB domain-containing protein [Bacteroidales bacterium]